MSMASGNDWRPNWPLERKAIQGGIREAVSLSVELARDMDGTQCIELPPQRIESLKILHQPRIAHPVAAADLADDQFGIHAQLQRRRSKRERSLDHGHCRLIL